MPHALSMPPTGFQAIILCGPGVSYDTFTSKAELSPKALIPIANRPMVWYALDFCYRMGITSKWPFPVLQTLHVLSSINLSKSIPIHISRSHLHGLNLYVDFTETFTRILCT